MNLILRTTPELLVTSGILSGTPNHHSFIPSKYLIKIFHQNDDAIEHMNKLASLSLLFSNDKKIQRYYLVKLFPFSLKSDAKVCYQALPYGSIKSPHELLDVFFAKYFPAHMQPNNYMN